jgi:hypothetical protein
MGKEKKHKKEKSKKHKKEKSRKRDRSSSDSGSDSEEERARQKAEKKVGTDAVTAAAQYTAVSHAAATGPCMVAQLMQCSVQLHIYASGRCLKDEQPAAVQDALLAAAAAAAVHAGGVALPVSVRVAGVVAA